MTYLVENTASRPVLIDTDWILIRSEIKMPILRSALHKDLSKKASRARQPSRRRAGAGAFLPQLGAGDAGAFYERFKLGPHHRGMLALNEFGLGEAAVGVGDYVFAAYQASEAQDAVRDQPGARQIRKSLTLTSQRVGHPLAWNELREQLGESRLSATGRLTRNSGLRGRAASRRAFDEVGPPTLTNQWVDWKTCAGDGAIGAEGKVKSRGDLFGDGTVGHPRATAIRADLFRAWL